MSREELAYLLRLAHRLGLTQGELFRLIGDPRKLTLAEALALLGRAARRPQQQRGIGP